jgi:transaldolase
VASFFVSRVDTAVDAELENAGTGELLGKIAVANSKIAYVEYKKILEQSRWQKLADKGAGVQRVLWASTSTKNPAYPDNLYVDELIGPDTVNTLPPSPLESFMDHGRGAQTRTRDVAEAQNHLWNRSANRNPETAG